MGDEEHQKFMQERDEKYKAHVAEVRERAEVMLVNLHETTPADDLIATIYYAASIELARFIVDQIVKQGDDNIGEYGISAGVDAVAEHLKHHVNIEISREIRERLSRA